MKIIKNYLAVSFVAYACVGLSALIGLPEGSGLLAAIIGVGLYAVQSIED